MRRAALLAQDETGQIGRRVDDEVGTRLDKLGARAEAPGNAASSDARVGAARNVDRRVPHHESQLGVGPQRLHERVRHGGGGFGGQRVEPALHSIEKAREELLDKRDGLLVVLVRKHAHMHAGGPQALHAGDDALVGARRVFLVGAVELDKLLVGSLKRIGVGRNVLGNETPHEHALAVAHHALEQVDVMRGPAVRLAHEVARAGQVADGVEQRAVTVEQHVRKTRLGHRLACLHVTRAGKGGHDVGQGRAVVKRGRLIGQCEHNDKTAVIGGHHNELVEAGTLFGGLEVAQVEDGRAVFEARASRTEHGTFRLEVDELGFVGHGLRYVIPGAAQGIGRKLGADKTGRARVVGGDIGIAHDILGVVELKGRGDLFGSQLLKREVARNEHRGAAEGKLLSGGVIRQIGLPAVEHGILNDEVVLGQEGFSGVNQVGQGIDGLVRHGIEGFLDLRGSEVRLGKTLGGLVNGSLSVCVNGIAQGVGHNGKIAGKNLVERGVVETKHLHDQGSIVHVGIYEEIRVDVVGIVGHSGLARIRDGLGNGGRDGSLGRRLAQETRAKHRVGSGISGSGKAGACKCQRSNGGGDALDAIPLHKSDPSHSVCPACCATGTSGPAYGAKPTTRTFQNRAAHVICFAALAWILAIYVQFMNRLF